MSDIAPALIQQGVLGIMCLLLVMTVIYLYRALQSCQDARLSEAKEIIKTTHESTSALNEQTRVIQTAISLLKA